MDTSLELLLFPCSMATPFGIPRHDSAVDRKRGQSNVGSYSTTAATTTICSLTHTPPFTQHSCERGCGRGMASADAFQMQGHSHGTRRHGTRGDSDDDGDDGLMEGCPSARPSPASARQEPEGMFVCLVAD
ncbi:hypothetical protein B0O80DRAFT_429602 [Mortierella sp. GBAus27b]|nr:hypothetical protein B0O80DRAFT_429602 [Mortierella sp. GBAus27b]